MSGIPSSLWWPACCSSHACTRSSVVAACLHTETGAVMRATGPWHIRTQLPRANASGERRLKRTPRVEGSDMHSSQNHGLDSWHKRANASRNSMPRGSQVTLIPTEKIKKPYPKLAQDPKVKQDGARSPEIPKLAGRGREGVTKQTPARPRGPPRVRRWC